ncbi:MAG TPA: hypothetical protein PK006_07110 [Saprospiraceae bacterium]|nr:hypothetical protein [Saprospiraceae bacterium]
MFQPFSLLRISLFITGIKLIGIGLLFLSAISCKSKQPEAPMRADIAEARLKEEDVKIRQCFLKADGKDTTYIVLYIKGDTVTGTMEWNPYESHGASGTLSGVKDANGELKLLYDYEIEGNRQYEAKLFKLYGQYLIGKVGPLKESARENTLELEDESKAEFLDSFKLVLCVER